MDRTTHLTEVELALYVDAIVLDAQVKLPEDILDHVADCTECKVELIELLELIDAEERCIDLRRHPYFGKI
jgi:hypothetical protein